MAVQALLSKLNLLRKKTTYQIFILSCWIIGCGFLIYFFYYSSLFQNLIERNILPQDKTHLIWISISLILSGIVICILAPSQSPFKDGANSEEISNFTKQNEFETVYSACSTLYDDRQYHEAKTKLEKLLENTNQIIPPSIHQQILKLLEKCNIALIVQKNIEKIRTLIYAFELSQAKEEYHNLNGFINHHLSEIPPHQIDEFEALFLELKQRETQ